MQNSPCDTKGVIRSDFVTKMEKQGFYEVCRFPIHLPDSVILEMVEKDTKLWLYAMQNYGVAIYTHAGTKSFFVNIPRQSHQNPSYSKRGPSRKRHQGRKNYN